MNELTQILSLAWRVLATPFYQIGEVPITLMVIIQLVATIVAAIVLSRVIQRALRRGLLSRSRISVGAQASITRVVHYIIVTIGVMVAIENVGIDLSALATITAVLMVGIGFGLQNITSNFISGLILLFERPIQVGDFVEVGGVLGTVRAINARSTTVDTLDNVSIIVPNANFVQENVTNWSHHDSKTRIHTIVGISRDADVELARETLLAVAKANAEILSTPPPRVQFRHFEGSSLEFHLLTWIPDPKRQYDIKSDLNFAVTAAFREKGIEIAYPQRDVHVHADAGKLLPGTGAET